MSYTAGIIDFKRNEILSSLSKNVGLIIRGKQCMVVILKSRHTLAFQKSSEEKNHIFVWAIGGSESDIRNYKTEINHFLAGFSNIFSKRDLNIQAVHDFTTSYLKYKFYNTKSAEPAILELILGELLENSMLFYTINHAGGSGLLFQQGAGIDVIGCGDDDAKRKLIDKLSILKMENLTAEEIFKKVRPNLKSYSGQFYGSAFVIEDKKK